jgi:hypothetical protein
MKPSEALTAHRDELRRLVSRYNVTRPRVFGSVLTGADTEESDLDLLVDPNGFHHAVYACRARACSRGTAGCAGVGSDAEIFTGEVS